MAHHDQIKALMPDTINGKTHDQLMEERVAHDKAVGAHNVNGVKMPWFAPQSNFEALKTFEVRDDDIFLVTYPRSGTHWAVGILQLILHDGKDDWDRSIMTTGLEHTLTPDPALIGSTVPGYKLYEGIKSPRCIPTHCMESFLPPQVWTKQAKVVYVARNPKDMVVSRHKLLRSALERLGRNLPNFNEYLWLFYFDELSTGSWFEHVLGYWKHKDDANVFFLKYEDLHKDLRGSICKLAKHLGKDLSDDVIDGIAERVTFGGMQKTYRKLDEVHGEKAKVMTNLLGNTAAPFLRKGKVGDWKNAFTVAQSALFDKVYALKMQGTGLQFDFEL